MSANGTEATASPQVTAEEPVQQVRKLWDPRGEAGHTEVPWQRMWIMPEQGVGERHRQNP